MARHRHPVPLVGFAAWSGTGKTTLLRKLIPVLRAREIAIGMIKHAHHDFDIDFPGKDSYELRKSGADQTVVCTATRMAVITEFSDPAEEPDLWEIIRMLDPHRADLVLVEGYKEIRFPKIELHRAELGKPWLYPEDDSIIAVACDDQPPRDTKLPILNINDIESIAAFIYQDYCNRE